MNISTPFLDETLQFIYNDVILNLIPEYFLSFEYTPWIFSILGSLCIGMAGILPLLIIPDDSKNTEKRKYLLHLICITRCFSLFKI